jgi:hypothetical protein
LLGGKLIINLNYKNIDIDDWDKFPDENKERILLLLESIYK